MIGILDCNNFFVSCERLFRPDLRTKPVAVLSSNDGCVVARSQEIKDLGIPMGVPYFQIKDIASKAGAVFFSSNFTLYRDVSARVMQALKDEVGAIEKYSIDESFFTMSDSITEAELLGIRNRIIHVTGIPVSIGVASTKTIAKQASKRAKKGTGVCILNNQDWGVVQNTVLCGEVWGIGRQTTTKLRSLEIKTVAELLQVPRSEIRKLFGVVGERIVAELSGVSVLPVEAGVQEARQSITSSRSFAKVIQNQSELASAISFHVAECAHKLRQEDLVALKMIVYLRASRFSDFGHRGGVKEIVLPVPTNKTSTLTKQALNAVEELYDSEIPYKKAGVVLNSVMLKRFVPTSLFGEESAEADSVLDELTDSLNSKFGAESLRLASVRTKNGYVSAKLRSQAYTTRWSDIPRVQAK